MSYKNYLIIIIYFYSFDVIYIIIVVCIVTSVHRVFACLIEGLQDRSDALLQSGQGAQRLWLRAPAQGPGWCGAVVQRQRERSQQHSAYHGQWSTEVYKTLASVAKDIALSCSCGSPYSFSMNVHDYIYTSKLLFSFDNLLLNDITMSCIIVSTKFS